MSHSKIVILGGGYAGLLATLRLAGKVKSHNTQITLVNGTDSFVERIRLHQVATGQDLKHYSIPHLLRGKGVDFVQAWVERIDPDARRLHLADGQTLDYDLLIYAAGSMIDKKSVPGVAEHAYTLSSTGARSAKKLHEHAQNITNFVVVGGGLTGIEAATEFAESYPHMQVTMIAREGVGSELSQKGQAYLLKTFERLGIKVVEESAAKIERGTLRLENGEVMAFDASLWAGAFAVSPLAKEAGFAINERGQMLLDENLRSISHPNVYGVGDASQPRHLLLRMACATAMPMGAHAANNVLAALKNEPQQPYDFGYWLQCISLGRRDGLVQFVKPDDAPRERIITGRAAAWIKEGICKFTVWSMQTERRFPGVYVWPKGGSKAAKAVQTEQTGYGHI